MDPQVANSPTAISDSITSGDSAIGAAAVDTPVLDPTDVDTPVANQPATSMLTDNPYVYVIRAYVPHATDSHATQAHAAGPPASELPIGRRDSLVEETFSVASSEARVDCMPVEMSKDVVKVSRKVLQRCNAVAGNAARVAKNWHRGYVMIR
jgi:hypothetical protein